jgi:hypothetical protein
MLTRQQPLTRTRCVLVGGTATAGAATLARLLVPTLDGPVPTVDEAVVRLCLAVLLAAAAWAWLAVLGVVVEAWRGRPTRHRSPAPLRRVVLLCCGVALVGPAGVASADADRPAPQVGIEGLPLPERATGPAHAPPPAPRSTQAQARHHDRTQTVVVGPGDCLWHLAAADLAPGASAAQVAAHWHAIYRRNTTVIGPDPDLIRPGQRLVLPPHRDLGGSP